jgi:hypothetical protein
VDPQGGVPLVGVEPLYWWLLTSRRWTPPRPINAYVAELLLRGQVPGVGARRQLVETTAKVLALRETMPDLVILPAHDPTAAQRLLESLC